VNFAGKVDMIQTTAPALPDFSVSQQALAGCGEPRRIGAACPLESCLPGRDCKVRNVDFSDMFSIGMIIAAKLLNT
jgi:hypothetical protein